MIRKKYHLNFRTVSIPYEDFNSLLQGFGCPVNAIVNKEAVITCWKFGGEVSEEKSGDFIRKVIFPKIKEGL